LKNDMESFTPKNVEQIHKILDKIFPRLALEYHVKTLGIFGSYIQQNQTPDSDLDLLVSFSEPPSLLRFIALENHLSDLLGIQVDLVMRDGLKPHLGEHILQEVVSV